MDETVLVDADIDESAEIYDVSDRAGKFHSLFQIVHVENVVAKHRRGEIVAQVASRLHEFFDYIGKRRFSDADLFADLIRSGFFNEFRQIGGEAF